MKKISLEINQIQQTLREQKATAFGMVFIFVFIVAGALFLNGNNSKTLAANWVCEVSPYFEASFNLDDGISNSRWSKRIRINSSFNLKAENGWTGLICADLNNKNLIPLSLVLAPTTLIEAKWNGTSAPFLQITGAIKSLNEDPTDHKTLSQCEHGPTDKEIYFCGLNESVPRELALKEANQRFLQVAAANDNSESLWIRPFDYSQILSEKSVPLVTTVTIFESIVKAIAQEKIDAPLYILGRGNRSLLVFTAASLTESPKPKVDLNLSGRLGFSDSQPAEEYVAEYSKTIDFQQIVLSETLKTNPAKLVAKLSGSYFLRLHRKSKAFESETSAPLALVLPFALNRERNPASEERIGDLLENPALALNGNRFRIQLSSAESIRTHNESINLQASELRGIRPKNPALTNWFYEFTKTPGFKNPLRVLPTSSLEFLPSQLPIGLSYLRVRSYSGDLESPQLGDFGPAAEIRTWISSPRFKETKFERLSQNRFRLNLKMLVEEARDPLPFRLAVDTLSKSEKIQSQQIFEPNSEFSIPLQMTEDPAQTLEYVLYYADSTGDPISPSVQLKFAIPPLLTPQEPKRSQPDFEIRIKESKNLAPVSDFKTHSVDLLSPLPNEVIVAQEGAGKLGTLKWRAPTSNQKGFTVEVATDADFATIVKSARTVDSQLTLTQPLPEGALFWRVRSGNKAWSSSQKFELVFE